VVALHQVGPQACRLFARCRERAPCRGAFGHPSYLYPAIAHTDHIPWSVGRCLATACRPRRRMRDPLRGYPATGIHAVALWRFFCRPAARGDAARGRGTFGKHAMIPCHTRWPRQRGGLALVERLTMAKGYASRFAVWHRTPRPGVDARPREKGRWYFWGYGIALFCCSTVSPLGSVVAVVRRYERVGTHPCH
jgi:hypothetical protein